MNEEFSQKKLNGWDKFREAVSKEYFKREFEDNRNLIFDLLIREIFLTPLIKRKVLEDDKEINLNHQKMKLIDSMILLFNKNKNREYTRNEDLYPLINSFDNLPIKDIKDCLPVFLKF